MPCDIYLFIVLPDLRYDEDNAPIFAAGSTAQLQSFFSAQDASVATYGHSLVQRWRPSLSAAPNSASEESGRRVRAFASSCFVELKPSIEL